MSSGTIDIIRVSRTFIRPGGAEPVRALDDVSVVLRAGETTAVVGPSGSGKTTLLNIVAGLDRADSGSVNALGEQLEGLDEFALTRWRRERVAMIFQAKGLIGHLTATENVELALRLAGTERSGRERQALAALESVGLASHADHRPGELSGGQQQRVAIARALATRAPILVADEPTGELDTETAASMIDHIVEHVASTGSAAFIATHDSKLSGAASQVIELVDGRLTDRSLDLHPEPEHES